MARMFAVLTVVSIAQVKSSYLEQGILHVGAACHGNNSGTNSLYCLSRYDEKKQDAKKEVPQGESRWLQNQIRRIGALKFSGQDVAYEVSEVAKMVIAPATGILLVAIVVGHVCNSSGPGCFCNRIPESAITVLVSLMFGFGLRWLIKTNKVHEEELSFLDATILNLLCMPIIMLDAGWSIKVFDFMSQIEYILIFAVPGTLITTAVVAYGTFNLGEMGYHNMTGLRESFIFGALIAATDPVATLASYKKLHIPEVQPLLNTIVMGEALLNDAVAITVFEMINHLDERANSGVVVFKMFDLLVGSLCWGIFSAAVGCLVLRVTLLGHHKKSSTLFVFLSAYFTYAVAQAFDYSGIVANLFLGIVYRIYGSQHFSPDGAALATNVFDLMGTLAETGIFVICGTSAALIDEDADFNFCVCAIVLVLFARVVSVVCCSGASNAIKRAKDTRPNLINAAQQVMIWLGGLRGGIAVVLSMEIGSWCEVDKQVSIIAATFMVVVVLLIFNGGATEPMLNALGLANKTLEPPELPVERTSRTGSTLLDAKGEEDILRVAGRHTDAVLQWMLVGAITTRNEDEESD